MLKFRLPLWTLLALVLLFGVCLGALKNPTEAVAETMFTFTVCLLCVATIVALVKGGPGRLLWLTVSVFGWAYLAFTFGRTARTPQLIVSAWVAKGLKYLARMTLGSTELTISSGGSTATLASPESIAFHQIGQSLATLVVGLVAALVVFLVIRPDRTKQSNTDATHRT